MGILLPCLILKPYQALSGFGIPYASLGIGNRQFQELDAKWIEALTRYAGAQDLEAVTVFWT